MADIELITGWLEEINALQEMFNESSDLDDCEQYCKRIEELKAAIVREVKAIPAGSPVDCVKAAPKIHWTQLNIMVERSTGKLGRLLEDAQRGRDTVGALQLNSDGSIREWSDVFVYADGEEPSPETPSIAVNWTGFETAVQNARSVEDSLSDV